jgi:glycosyltransferase involved in cell wall biosynthesis
MTRPLDVCFVLPSLAVGGAERVVVNLANGLLAAGHAPRLLLTDAEGPLRAGLAAGVPVTALARRSVRAALPRVIRHVRRRPPDVILSTHTHVNLALSAARGLLPRETRLVLREPIHAPLELEGRSTSAIRRAQRALYRRADLLLASSRVLGEDLRSLTNAHVEILMNPVDIAGLRREVTDPQRPPSEGPREGRRFVTVGRLTRQKAVEDLLTAFACGADDDDRLTVFGDGPEREPLMRAIERLSLTGRVVMAGVRDDHWAALASADRFVLASRHEGMPNVVLESLALGTPVVATTDLEMLEELARIAPDGAIDLVERSQLSSAIAETVRRDVTAVPGPSLLPEEFALHAVAQRLIALLVSLRET